ncbi:MAG: hypothetical protein E7509_05235 [Ruminococcus sp.]|nr:hypothetical protein [Ruminococcus sp.]
MKKIFIILASAVMLMMCGCEEKPDNNIDTDDIDTMTLEGRFMKVENGHYIIIANEDQPTVMRADDKSLFDGLTTGDLIKIECTYIEMTYPGRTAIFDLELLEDGTISDISDETIKSLEDLGWVAVSE